MAFLSELQQLTDDIGFDRLQKIDAAVRSKSGVTEKHSYNNRKKLLQNWIHDFKSNVNYLNLLASEFRKIKREDVAEFLERKVPLQDLRNDETQPLLQKWGSLSTYTPPPKELIQSEADIMQSNQMNEPHLLPPKYKDLEDIKAKNKHRIITRSCSFLLGLVLVAIILATTVFFIVSAIYLLPPKSTVKAIVAENDTVNILQLSSLTVSSINIKEVVLYGDAIHRAYATIVPTKVLKRKEREGADAFSGITISKIPIIDEAFMYFLKNSTLEYKICIGNAEHETSTHLYIFDDEENYNDYLSSDIAISPVFTQKVKIGGKNDPSCTYVNFTAKTDSYYFAVLMIPHGDIQVTYNVTAFEKIFDITDYLSDYPICILDKDRDCTFYTSPSYLPKPQDFSILIYMQPNYDFNSKLTHVQVTLHNRSNLIAIPAALFGGSCLVIFLISSTIVYCSRRHKKNRKYLVISS